MGALQIPIGTYHRSESGQEGSIVLNLQLEMVYLIQKKNFHLSV